MYWSRGLLLWMVQRKCRCRNLKRVDGTTQEFVSGAFTKTSIKSPTRLLTQRLRHCRLCLRRAYVDSPYAMSLRKLTRLRVSFTQAASLLWHNSFNSRAREVSKMLHWCLWKSTSSALRFRLLQQRIRWVLWILWIPCWKHPSKLNISMWTASTEGAREVPTGVQICQLWEYKFHDNDVQILKDSKNLKGIPFPIFLQLTQGC